MNAIKVKVGLTNVTFNVSSDYNGRVDMSVKFCLGGTWELVETVEVNGLGTASGAEIAAAISRLQRGVDDVVNGILAMAETEEE